MPRIMRHPPSPGGAHVAGAAGQASPRHRIVTGPAAVALSLALVGLTAAAVAAAAVSPAPASPPGAEATASPAPPPQPAPEEPSGPPEDAIVRFHSRPDLTPPVITIAGDAVDAGDATKPEQAGEGGPSLFVTPRYGGEGEGVMILDAQGRLVWLHRVPGRSAVSLKPLTFAGQPAISWWEGVIERGLGDGEFVVMGRDYHELARIRAVRQPADLHELLVTPDGSAYLFAMDLIEQDGQLIDDMLVQEVDIATGRLLWEWRASDHIGTDESVEPAPEEGPWDYVHLNSIDLAPDGDLLLSARHTDAIYKVSRESGDVIWRLGGPRSDFQLAPEAVFAKQHDARWLADGSISLFDNSTDDSKDPEARPRGLVLRLDEAAGTAELVRELLPPRSGRVDSSSQGNLSVADDGTATVGWGSANLVTSYDADGSVTWDAAMPPGFSSYRAYRADWEGRPTDDPLVSVGHDEDGAINAWVSWNGATEVASWELLAGEDPAGLAVASDAPADGFEAALAVPDEAVVIAVRALAGDGEVLGQSALVWVEAALAEPVPAG